MKNFYKWLEEQELAPYRAIFDDIPEFIRLAYIQKYFRHLGIQILIGYCDSGYFGNVSYIDNEGRHQDYETDGYFTSYEECLKNTIKKNENLIKDNSETDF